jgi:type II secretory pathway pseudopilin PulG
MLGSIAPDHSGQKPARSAETGFTLVEAIVAAIVSVVLGGVILTIFKMNNDGVKDGAVNAKVQAQYETAMAEIGANVRKASAVLDANATPIEGFPPAATLTTTSTSKIVMVDGNNNKFRGFWVDNGVLKECAAGWNNADYIPFKVGAWSTLSVPCVPNCNRFQLSSDRKTLTVSMSVTGTFSGNTATAPARGEVFTCRN